MSVGTLEKGQSVDGIYDLAGNVSEWTDADYDESHKVFRGGAWSDDAGRLKASERGWGDGSAGSTNVGFRCVQDLPS
jgi:formylglycine-generating enzyme required for sulfatase activity